MVSKTIVEGSIPSIPAKSQDHQLSWWLALTALQSVAAYRKRMVKFCRLLDYH
jgi:hypothetical protein